MRMHKLRMKWHLCGRQQALAELASRSRPRQCCMPWGPRAFIHRSNCESVPCTHGRMVTFAPQGQSTSHVHVQDRVGDTGVGLPCWCRT